MLFGLKKKKINDDGCSYFKTFLFLHLVPINSMPLLLLLLRLIFKVLENCIEVLAREIVLRRVPKCQQ